VSDDVIDLGAKRVARADGLALVLEFDTNDPEFARGFEVGLLHGILVGQPETWAGMYHVSNQDMIRRLAEHHEYELRLVPTSDPTWVQAFFSRHRGA
jgi:hypothetical protein